MGQQSNEHLPRPAAEVEEALSPVEPALVPPFERSEEALSPVEPAGQAHAALIVVDGEIAQDERLVLGAAA